MYTWVETQGFMTDQVIQIVMRYKGIWRCMRDHGMQRFITDQGIQRFMKD